MVKKLVSVLCICAYFGLAHAQIPQEIWKESEQIEKQIKKTSFPDRVYNIKDFGAKEGNNGEILCHEAINLAILTCSQTGGGTVLVPPGEFLTGPITLKSNVNLHLEEGAYLKFSSEKYLYTPTVLTRWEGVDCYNLHPLIYAYGESNIGITGKGIIDGQASNDNWWSMCGAPHYGWKEGMTAQKNGGRDKLLMYAETFAPIDKRQTTFEDGLRPQLINLYRCNTILIENVTLKNSPFWVIHPLFCESLTVRGVKLCPYRGSSRSRRTGNQHPFLADRKRISIRFFRTASYRYRKQYQETDFHPRHCETGQQSDQPHRTDQPTLCQRSQCCGIVQPILPAGYQYRHHDIFCRRCIQYSCRLVQRTALDCYRFGTSSSDRLCHFGRCARWKSDSQSNSGRRFRCRTVQCHLPKRQSGHCRYDK